MAKSIQYKITTDGKAISAMVADIKTRSGVLKGDIHIAACSIIAHAVKHGDATLATHMPTIITDALGDAWRLNALRQWFEEFGPFTWHAKEGDKPAGFRIDKARRTAMSAEMQKTGETEYVDKLVTVKTYWEFKPEPEFKAFSTLAMLGRLVAEAKKKAADDKRKAIGKDEFVGLSDIETLYLELKAKTEAKAKVVKVVKAKASKAKAA